MLPSIPASVPTTGTNTSTPESSTVGLGEKSVWKTPSVEDPLEASSVAKYELMFANALSVRRTPDYDYVRLITIRYESDDTGAEKDLDDVKQTLNQCCGIHHCDDIVIKKPVLGQTRWAIRQITYSFDDILEELSVEHQSVAKKGLLIIYYAGHGKLNRMQQDDKLWLGTGTIEDGTAADFDAVRDHLFNSGTAQWRALLSRTNLLFVLDCCYSGRAAKFRSQEYIVSVLAASSEYSRTPTRDLGRSFTLKFIATIKRLARIQGALAINMADVAGELQEKKKLSAQLFNIVGTGNILLPLSKSAAVPTLKERSTNLVKSVAPNPLSGRATTFPALPSQMQGKLIILIPCAESQTNTGTKIL